MLTTYAVARYGADGALDAVKVPLDFCDFTRTFDPAGRVSCEVCVRSWQAATPSTA